MKTLYYMLLLIGLLAFTAQADLGLQQILDEQGAKAVGMAVHDAAAALFADDGADAAAVAAQITAMLDEAAATGDEEAIRWALIAAMAAGGAENMGLTKEAIAASKVSSEYSELVESTVAEVEALLGGGGAEGEGSEAAGGEEGEGGGEEAGGGGGGGEKDDTLGGGDPFEFLFDLEIDDHDVPATPV